MSYIVHKIIGGHKYAYEITSYWDSETKTTKKKQQYIGVVEDKSKPSKKLTQPVNASVNSNNIGEHNIQCQEIDKYISLTLI